MSSSVTRCEQGSFHASYKAYGKTAFSLTVWPFTMCHLRASKLTGSIQNIYQKSTHYFRNIFSAIIIDSRSCLGICRVGNQSIQNFESVKQCQFVNWQNSRYRSVGSGTFEIGWLSLFISAARWLMSLSSPMSWKAPHTNQWRSSG